VTAEQAYTRWKSRFFPSRSDLPDGVEEIPAIIIELGHRYENSPAISYTHGVKEMIYEDPFWPTAQSGSRAPHIRFRKGDGVVSLYDYFDVRKFVLLCSKRGTAWQEARESFPIGWPLRIVVVLLGEFFSKYGIRDTGAVLVRPDGVIAWKAVTDSEVDKLGPVMSHLLGLKIGGQQRPQATRAATAPAMAGPDKNVKPPAPTGLLRRMTLSIKRRGGS
jgi:putative polyketide hydroxylase